MISPSPELRPVILPPTQWTQLRTKLSDPFLADLAGKNRRALRLYEETRRGSPDDIPSCLSRPDGNRIQWGWRATKGRILRAAIECHLGDVDFALPLARESIALLLRPETWAAQFPATGARHFDLKVADMITASLLALEGLAPWLDASEREGLVTRIAESGLAGYLRGLQEREWWWRCNFNWASATHGAAGLGALALAEIHPDLSAQVLREADAGLRHLIAHLPADGWWFEGSMYHTTMLGHLSDFVIGSVLNRGDDLGLTSNPRFVEALESRPSCLAPDGQLFNFSNCPESPDEWYLPQVYWWSDRLGRPDLARFEDLHVKSWDDAAGVFYDVEAFLHRRANPPPTAATTPRSFVHFRGLDWITWRGPQAWAAFRSGFVGANHNNSDLGHFILGRGATRYLVDPGYGHTHTSFHNAVTVRGHAQTDGARARITTLRQLSGGGFHLVCDLREAYPHTLSTHHRHLVLTDAGGLLIDRIVATPGLPARFYCKVHFQTRQDVVVEGNAAHLPGADGTVSLVPLTPMKSPSLLEQPLSRQNEHWTLRQIGYAPQFDEEELLLAWKLDFSDVMVPLAVRELTPEVVAFTLGTRLERISLVP